MQLWYSPPSIRLSVWARHQDNRFFSCHAHAFYELGIVLKGKCDWVLGHRRLCLEAGEIVLVKPRTFHREEIRKSASVELAWLGFDFAGPPPAWAHRAVATGSDFPEITGYFKIIAREHHRIESPTSRQRAGLAAQSLFLLLERRNEDAPKEPDSRRGPRGSDLNPRQIGTVESAAHYFRANLQNSLSIAQVAAYHSLCLPYFSSLFRRHHGVSPRDFLRRQRRERAASLLRESDLTLKEIAAQTGFFDATHFCKSFKRDTGFTPRAFRLGKPPNNADLEVALPTG